MLCLLGACIAVTKKFKSRDLEAGRRNTVHYTTSGTVGTNPSAANPPAPVRSEVGGVTVVPNPNFPIDKKGMQQPSTPQSNLYPPASSMQPANRSMPMPDDGCTTPLKPALPYPQ